MTEGDEILLEETVDSLSETTIENKQVKRQIKFLNL
jgi:hypothetical protein